MTKYNVLWIDDESDTDDGLKLFLKQAEGEGIILFPYKSYEEAFENFESKIFEYDAILLDASFFKSKSQVAGTDDLQGLAAAKEKITEFRIKKNIPFFILTGQIRFDNDGTFSQTYGKYYRKQNRQEVIQLFKDIKEAADKQPLTQIRHKHQNVFDVCTEKYIGEAASKPLMDILRSMEYPYENFDDKNYFNALRQIVELFFRASYRLGILHEKFISEKDGSVNLGNSKSFMSGDAETIAKAGKTIICSKNYFPKILANNLESILNITNAGSHTSGKEKEELTKPKPTLAEYKEQIKSNYLLYSTTFQVMDLLLWFKNYADENPDVEKNKLEWKK